jgi:hypothetical protein
MGIPAYKTNSVRNKRWVQKHSEKGRRHGQMPIKKRKSFVLAFEMYLALREPAVNLSEKAIMTGKPEDAIN